MKEIPEEQHNHEIKENLKQWKVKQTLQDIYHDFYTLIAGYMNKELEGDIVELGSGIGNLKTVIPNAICTDLFDNPWIDQVENAYQLSFKDNSLSHIILFDVFHHLQFPGTALQEFYRVLKNDGKVIIFDPDISILGLLVYGLFHHEPVAYNKKIQWHIPHGSNPLKLNYYAAQGNANRIFIHQYFKDRFKYWETEQIRRIASVSYIATGGYSKNQLFPDSWFSTLKKMDKIFSWLPQIFSTRLLVVLRKRNNGE